MALRHLHTILSFIFSFFSLVIHSNAFPLPSSSSPLSRRGNVGSTLPNSAKIEPYIRSKFPDQQVIINPVSYGKPGWKTIQDQIKGLTDEHNDIIDYRIVKSKLSKAMQVNPDNLPRHWGALELAMAKNAARNGKPYLVMLRAGYDKFNLYEKEGTFAKTALPYFQGRWLAKGEDTIHFLLPGAKEPDQTAFIEDSQGLYRYHRVPSHFIEVDDGVFQDSSRKGRFWQEGTFRDTMDGPNSADQSEPVDLARPTVSPPEGYTSIKSGYYLYENEYRRWRAGTWFINDPRTQKLVKAKFQGPLPPTAIKYVQGYYKFPHDKRVWSVNSGMYFKLARGSTQRAIKVLATSNQDPPTGAAPGDQVEQVPAPVRQNEPNEDVVAGASGDTRTRRPGRNTRPPVQEPDQEEQPQNDLPIRQSRRPGRTTRPPAQDRVPKDEPWPVDSVDNGFERGRSRPSTSLGGDSFDDNESNKPKNPIAAGDDERRSMFGEPFTPRVRTSGRQRQNGAGPHPHDTPIMRTNSPAAPSTPDLGSGPGGFGSSSRNRRPNHNGLPPPTPKGPIL